MNQPPILLLLSFCLLMASPFTTKGQTILQQKTCKDIEHGYPHYEWLNKDPTGGYILSIAKDETDTEGLFIDNALIPTYNHSEDDGSFLHDFFICKLNSDFEIENSFVMDNAELGRDVFCGEDYVLYSMSIVETSNNTDSFPILLNGDFEVPREGRHGTGLVLVLNKQLELFDYFFPSTGEIGEVAIDGHMAYLELRIPNNEPYIIINQTDTVYNHLRSEDPNDYGRQTVVLCKINLLTSQVEWTQRIGNVGYEELREMLIDHNHNLVILGETSSHYFSFNDVDTVINNADHSPFVAKYSPDGNFVTGFINPNDENAYSRSMILDGTDNIYILGYYYGNNYVIEDTVLVRPGIGRPNASQGIIFKLLADGSFAWIMQAEGDFGQTDFYDAIDLNQEELVMSGEFSDGQIILNEQLYVDDPVANQRFGYLLLLDKQSGKILNHIMTKGDYRRIISDIETDNSGNLDLFLRYYGRDTIFGNVFESQVGINGYMIKLDLLSVANKEFDIANSIISVVPNPVSDSGFNLTLTNYISPIEATYIIINVMGHIIERNIIIPDMNNYISTVSWPAGPYWLQVFFKNQVQTQLIIIQ